jgi:hypothetical protein
VLTALKNSFVNEIARLQDDIQFESEHYARTLAVMQNLPVGFVDSVPKVEVDLAKNLTEKISQVDPMARKIIEMFKKIEEPLTLVEMATAHSELVGYLSDLKAKIATPFKNPIMMLPENTAKDLPKGSQFGTLNKDKQLILWVKDIEESPGDTMIGTGMAPAIFDFKSKRKTTVQNEQTTFPPFWDNDTDTTRFFATEKWWAGASAWAKGFGTFCSIVFAAWGPLPIFMSGLVIFNFWLNIIQTLLLCFAKYKRCRRRQLPRVRKMTWFRKNKDLVHDDRQLTASAPPPPRRRKSISFAAQDPDPVRRPLVKRTTRTSEIVEEHALENMPLQPAVYSKKRAPREPPPKYMYNKSDVPLYMY